jgi:hypothetical protein
MPAITTLQDGTPLNARCGFKIGDSRYELQRYGWGDGSASPIRVALMHHGSPVDAGLLVGVEEAAGSIKLTTSYEEELIVRSAAAVRSVGAFIADNRKEIDYQIRMHAMRRSTPAAAEPAA